MDDDEIDEMVAQMKADTFEIRPDDVDEWNRVISDLEHLKTANTADRESIFAYYSSRATSMYLRRREPVVSRPEPVLKPVDPPESSFSSNLLIGPQVGGSDSTYVNLALLGVVVVSSIMSSMRV